MTDMSTTETETETDSSTAARKNIKVPNETYQALAEDKRDRGPLTWAQYFERLQERAEAGSDGSEPVGMTAEVRFADGETAAVDVLAEAREQGAGE